MTTWRTTGGMTAIVLTASLLIVSCSGKKQASGETGAIKAVATIGMIADVVKEIGGKHVHVHGLMGPGVDPHLYKATPSDVQALHKADIIFYNGLHLEAKMGELFERMGETRATVAVTRAIPESLLIAPESYEGLHDPHVWFDVTLWKYATREIADALAKERPNLASHFDSSAAAYLARLDTLHAYVETQAKRVPPEQRMLITAHDAFNYFGNRYGFEVIGLQGISTEAEAGTNDVQKLVNLIVERRMPAIFVESSVPIKNIEAVQEAVQSKQWSVSIGGELFSDAMGDAGTVEGTYIGMVTHNINTIVSVLLGNVADLHE
jgi:manganese/zinc/iron transport system substrate-binding protein